MLPKPFLDEGKCFWIFLGENDKVLRKLFEHQEFFSSLGEVFNHHSNIWKDSVFLGCPCH